MKQVSKYLISGLFSVLAFTRLPAQSNDWQETKTEADSSQRIWMRQTLQVHDSIISRVFAIRDSMYQLVNGIRSQPNPGNEQDYQVMAIRKITGDAIRVALGDATYQLYKQHIRQRLQKAGKVNELPLTGTDN